MALYYKGRKGAAANARGFGLRLESIIMRFCGGISAKKPQSPIRLKSEALNP